MFTMVCSPNIVLTIISELELFMLKKSVTENIGDIIKTRFDDHTRTFGSGSKLDNTWYEKAVESLCLYNHLFKMALRKGKIRNSRTFGILTCYRKFIAKSIFTKASKCSSRRFFFFMHMER